MTYDVHYFIAKFEAIPDEDWCTLQYEDADGRHCALGFCGERYGGRSDEAAQLRRIIYRLGVSVDGVNDGSLGKLNWGDTPRERILNALYEIRRREREHG